MLNKIVGAVFAAALVLAIAAWPARAAGALAIGECGAYGDAYDYPNLAEARAAALQHCAGQCRVVASIRKSCVAFAIDGRNACGPHGFAVAARLGEAQNTALRYCYRYGGRDCVIRAWACDGRN